MTGSGRGGYTDWPGLRALGKVRNQMKKLSAVLSAAVGALAVVGLANLASAQAPSRQLEATYIVHARGVDAGEFTYRFSQNGASYETSAKRRATGPARWIVGDDQDYSYS